MSESILLLPSFAYLASTMASLLGDQIRAFFSKYNIYGICSPSPASIEFIVKNTSAEHVVFINLDKEIQSELDEDDLKKAKESGLQLNRVVYTKGKKVVNSVQDIVQGSQKSVQHLVFLSSDYRLLKFVGAKCKYFCPSDNYIRENPTDKIDEKLRSDLVKRKMDKLVVFNHQNDFLDMVCKIYKTKINI